MTLDKDALSALIDAWGNVEDIATIIVTLGVIGESVELIPRLVKRPSLRHWINLASTIVLIAGLVGELISQHMLSNFNGRLIAIIDSESAAANARASQANMRASAIEKQAADLGVTEGTLDLYVKGEKAKADQAIATLRVKEADLERASRETDAREAKVRSHIAHDEAALKDAAKTARTAYDNTLPRMIEFCTAWWPLKNRPKPSGVELLYSASGGDTALLAESIEGCLEEADWPRSSPRQIPPGRHGSRELMTDILASGVVVLGSPSALLNKAASFGDLFAPNTPEDDVVNALQNSFNERNIELKVGIAPDLSKGKIRIIVWPR